MPFELKFKVIFKRGPKEVAVVEGVHAVAPENITVAEMQNKVIETEAFLEKLTGLRVHINQMY